VISSAAQKFVASGVNCSMVFSLTWSFRYMMKPVHWKLLTVFVFWIYEVVMQGNDFGMALAGTHCEPTGILAATCYSCSFCSIVFRIYWPGDLTIINGCMQIYCLSEYHNTLHGLIAGYRTMTGAA
jgi:hypothetical protein